MSFNNKTVLILTAQFGAGHISAANAIRDYILEKYIIKGLEEVYERSVVTSGLPSSARIRVRQEKTGKFLAIHVLYAPPINRGNVCLLPDFPVLHDVKIELTTDKKINSAMIMPDKAPVSFTQNGNKVTLEMPPFSLHKLIILK